MGHHNELHQKIQLMVLEISPFLFPYSQKKILISSDNDQRI